MIDLTNVQEHTSPPNPYSRMDQWYFYDETGDEYGPFRSERKATRELAKYLYWLDNGPTPWQRFLLQKWKKLFSQVEKGP